MLWGDAVNPDATVYQLDPNEPIRSQAYLVAENGAALVQLDRELKPIETKMNLTLRKV